MNNRIISAVLAATLTLAGSSAYAQVTMSKISANRISASGIHTPYTFCELHDTPAPEGYVPVYISHVGRHGSRYNTNEKELLSLVQSLDKCDSLGILTKKGKELKRQIGVLYNESKDRFGALSERGADEHRTIAKRMYGRYNEVFSKRKKVQAASSTSIRCVLSMSNFGTALACSDPVLDISYRADDRTKKYLMKNTGIGEIEKKRRELVYPIRKEEFNPDRFFDAICTDENAMRKVIKDRRHFCKDLYVAGGIVHCIDLDKEIELYDFFTDQELYTLARLDCFDFFGDHANSKEFGKKRVAMADELVQDIIDKADAALADGSQVAADIRFTHDWMVSPLFSMIGIKGMDKRISLTSSDKYWMTSDFIPMAANLQMIFYTNGKDKVLIKVLHNEKETFIPGIKSESGPYYSWDTMKNWLSGRIQEFRD